MRRPRTAVVQGVQLPPHLPFELGRQPSRRGDAELAGVGAGAGGDVADRLRAGTAEAEGVQLAMERRQVRLAHPAQHDVLLDGGADGVADVPAGDVGEPPELIAVDVAEGQAHRHHRVPRLALAVDVRARPGGEARRVRLPVEGLAVLQRLLVRRRQVREVGGPALVAGEAAPLFLHQPPKLVDAEPGHQELDAGAGPVALLAEPREHPRDRLEGREDVGLGHERIEELRLVGHRAEAPPHVDLEPALGPRGGLSGDRDRPEVVHVHEAARVLPATREGHLELAAEVLGVGVPEEEPHGRAGVGGHVEGLVAADPRERAGGDVADGVAARFAGGDAHRREPAHQGRGVVHVDEVELHVLPGGDVADAVAVLLGEVGEGFHLLGGQPPERDLDALHAGGVPHRVGALGQPVRGEREGLDPVAVVPLPVVVALPVGPAPQAGLREHLVVDAALALQGDLVLEGVDLPPQLRRDAIAESFLPGHLELHPFPAARGGVPAAFERRHLLPDSAVRRLPAPNLGVPPRGAGEVPTSLAARARSLPVVTSSGPPVRPPPPCPAGSRRASRAVRRRCR